MGGFEESYQFDADDDNFLSADGKTRKEKRTAKKAEKKAKKESKLRDKKGAEISAAVNQSMGGLLGMPMMIPPPEEKKGGLKGLVSNIKEKRDKRQADKLFEKDYKRAVKSGTLTKVSDDSDEDPEPTQKKKRDLSGIKNTVLGLPSLLGLGSKDEEPAKKKVDNGATARYAMIGLGVVALGFILFSKMGQNKTQTK